jgi:hypothetical protein
MGYRRFRDVQGVEWQVWEVRPGTSRGLEGWDGADRRSPDPVLLYKGPERRSGPPRPTAAPILSPGLECGWLTFESETEKRRLVPIPEGWEEMDEATLEELRARAQPATRLRS